jgi:class 3 adenylate cyclase
VYLVVLASDGKAYWLNVTEKLKGAGPSVRAIEFDGLEMTERSLMEVRKLVLSSRQRDFEVFVESARGETSTPSFMAWAGGERVTLAIVFTDVVESTALGTKVGDAEMNDVRRAHFAQGRNLLEQHKGREIKTIGDSFMAAFHSVDEALDFALALQSNPGDPQIQVRAGIHVGAMQVEGNDVFGGTVNFAARVVGAIKDAEIWLSNRAQEDIDALRAKRHSALKWQRHDAVAMKGFPDMFTLWSLVK